MHLLSLLLVVVNLSPISALLNNAPSQQNHAILASGPEHTSTLTDGPEYPGVAIADGPEYPGIFA